MGRRDGAVVEKAKASIGRKPGVVSRWTAQRIRGRGASVSLAAWTFPLSGAFRRGSRLEWPPSIRSSRSPAWRRRTSQQNGRTPAAPAAQIRRARASSARRRRPRRCRRDRPARPGSSPRGDPGRRRVADRARAVTRGSPPLRISVRGAPRARGAGPPAVTGVGDPAGRQAFQEAMPDGHFFVLPAAPTLLQECQLPPQNAPGTLPVPFTPWHRQQTSRTARGR